MDGSWPENLDTIKMVIEELMKGQELANQLRCVLSKSDDPAGSVENLLMKIMKSFSTTLSILNVKSSVISQTQADFQVGLPCLVARKSEDSQESCKSYTVATPTKKNHGGCYERRTSLTTWKRDTPTLINDGQAWRKYGQKGILNAKYPRHYFRCTYKNDQGCKATKRVQRIQVNPPLYRTIYYGHHTCKDLLKNPEMILECNTSTSPTDNTSSIFFSFDTSNHTNLKNVQHHPFFLSIKQEYKEEKTSCDDVDHNQPLSLLSSDYFVSPDLMAAAESPEQSMTVLSSTQNFDHEGFNMLDDGVCWF